MKGFLGAMEAHLGALTAHPGAVEAQLRIMVFILRPLRLIWYHEGCLGAIEVQNETLRFIQESFRLSLEPWRLALEP